ncbi:CHAT domain protein [Streptomyces sp. S4.7]|uniref:CHAT domain-containing protein n=1 Tax=Streptomyces sp. S4.7 TaxID=2705439 RepID=UPI0013992D80|nr:CHAT domain-containing protein [Streptomyces sp. S4.7]QHY98253.1 CHAT domain protein [Streptomyces sp. S4.7]
MTEERLAAVQARLKRIADTGDPSPALEPQALIEARMVAELLSGDIRDPRNIPVCYALGWLHFHRYTALPDSQRDWDLDAAMDAFTPCFLAGTSGLPEPLLPLLANRAATWSAMEGAVERAFVPARRQSDLDKTINSLQTVIRDLPADHPDRAVHLANLGASLSIRFGRTRDVADLDSAVSATQAAVDAMLASHPDRAKCLSNLAVMLQARFKQAGDVEDLSRAVTIRQEAVQATPVDHPARAERLGNLGAVLQIRFERAGDVGDLDLAVSAAQAALDATPVDHPDRAGRLSNLGAALQARFERTGDLEDVDAAIDCFQAAVLAASADDGKIVAFLLNLGLALRVRFERTGDVEALGRAVTVSREALQVTPVDHPARATCLSNLGTVLQIRFERIGDLADMEQAIVVGREAVDALPADDPRKAEVLGNLGVALQVRFGRTGDVGDLDLAVSAAQAALDATPVDHPDRAPRLGNLGAVLQVRFGRTGDVGDLDLAVSAAQAALDATPVDHPDRARWLSNLGAALQARFVRTGDLADVSRAVTVGQEAVLATPVDHPDRAGWLSNLGVALQARFRRTGDLEDVDAAIDCFQAAVLAASADDGKIVAFLVNLGAALEARFGRTGDLADVSRAVTVGQEAVLATPVDHPARATCLSNLGAVLQARFERTGELADMEQAIVVGREAVDAMPSDDPRKAGVLGNLGAVLQIRFERTGDLADMEQAIVVGREAVDAMPADHPDRAMALYTLGGSLRNRVMLLMRSSDLKAAVSAFTEVSGVVSAAPSLRIRAARAAVELLAGTDAARAADTAEAAVRLLPEVILRQLGRGDQQHELGQFAGLAGNAAALALSDPRGTRQERATRALRLLETGRAVLLSQALDARSDLTDLNEQRPDLAERFVQQRDLLDQPLTRSLAGASEEMNALKASLDRVAQDRHLLASDFAQTLTEIRDLTGFASFAQPPTTEELLTQAEQGPVVMFNISARRSDTLLLTQDGGITHLELPQLTADALTERTVSFQQALHTATTGRDRTQRRQGQDAMTGVLQWLWDAAAGPVLDALGHHRQPPADADWPRVWWAPGGLLGLLPLHAAGYHDDPADDPHRRTVMDRVISSYTPTIRALRYARQHTREHTPYADTPAQGLIVAMSTTPGLPQDGRLNHVSAEAEMLRRHLPSTVVLREPDPDGHLAGPPPSRPTKAAVLDHLPHCPIVHFACHGASHPTDPSQSLLLLHDHQSAPFTVASLTPVRLDHAQLVYLSACRTAAIDTVNLVDEAIHLTSAFQLAGFPHVVGTLWEIDDQIAVTVADAFYTHLRTPDGTIDTSRAAWALHQAVRSVRDGYDLPGRLNRTRSPFLWAAYLHAGA